MSATRPTTSADEIRAQTQQICLAAVKQDNPAIHYIRAQIPELYHAAIQQNRAVFDAFN